MATFPTSDEATQQAIDSILREEDRKPSLETLERELEQRNGEVFIDNVEQTPEVAAEQIIESEVPVPVTVVKVRKSPRVTTRTGMTLRPGRHVIRPGSKVGFFFRKYRGGEQPTQIFELQQISRHA